MDVINLDERSGLGGFLAGFSEYPRDNDSFQKSVVSGLFPLIKNYVPSSGKVLEVGFGSNVNVMNYLVSKGYNVNGIDFQPVNDYVSRTSAGLIEGDVVDFKGSGFGLIYFWGSWGAAVNNFTIDEVLSRKSKKGLDSRKAGLIKKCCSMLERDGSLMVLSSDFARHGGGYGFNIDSIVKDYNSLRDYLTSAGFSSVVLAGLSRDRVESLMDDKLFSGALNSPFAISSEPWVREYFAFLNKYADANFKLKPGVGFREVDEFPGFASKFHSVLNELRRDFSESIKGFKGSDIVVPYLIVARK